MKRVCAWCKKDLGTIKTEMYSESLITHGICEECKNAFFDPLKTTLMDFLDGLNVPVIVVDATVSINSANRQARELLHKELPRIVGFKGGDVFECAYAALPEGCGKTIHCVGCAIRNTVVDTFRTGTSHLEIPAYLNHTIDNGPEIRFLISTEKVNDVVLLRIDKVGSN